MITNAGKKAFKKAAAAMLPPNPPITYHQELIIGFMKKIHAENRDKFVNPTTIAKGIVENHRGYIGTGTSYSAWTCARLKRLVKLGLIEKHKTKGLYRLMELPSEPLFVPESGLTP